MIRTLTAAIILAMISIPSAQAAVNFSGVRCEAREMIDVLEDKFRTSRAFGNQLASYGVLTGKISKSVTEHASRNKLVCGITTQATINGATQHLRLRATIRQFSDGKLTIEFSDR